MHIKENKTMVKLHLRILAVLLLAAFARTVASPVIAADNDLVTAMSNMLRAMGFNNQNNSLNSLPATSWPLAGAQPWAINPIGGMNPMNGLNPMNSLNPMGGSYYPYPGNWPNLGNSQPWNFGNGGDQWSMQSFFPGTLNLFGSTGIDGYWYSSNGETLQIQGNRFRLTSTDNRQLEGLIQTRDNYLAMHNPLNQVTNLYEYAYDNDRLVMKDPQEQLFLYRRMGR
jgi:hypothetical protein